ncbi:hypothetical protein LC2W_1289 [Lacticaseibacillus paracasei]|jgi:hypothetical protein|uniref:Uncharacterized protein n=3 Tax=Lacticaseibacillus paracasei subsp. paracasei TaxID=47714 RepID=S2NXK7_LACPA|nr:hypothetical protein LCAZH_1108 [Lacticaseibacillus paracasei]EEI67063.1 hypothetical protein HMPREF0530_2686 [Lacticaseibacillus paracasei subsp. paracasei ATCC 25302 = DSM 5622 = JCM 8130]EPC22054.1 hypothetical protein Lpp226_0666 [Lacticaseibacillus paracasei subsp. paracasei Lpp226]EPC24558.1 hypothetical protein Lpp46_2592 [Lacticaseibacillus paracasei subsp. paracasei Lpp46]EPC24597.1 hypothetical protein Lpp17_1709 [Lacticaseibacillus paracasei subsp. paracasei Lpp17]EPC30129.1 hypo
MIDLKKLNTKKYSSGFPTARQAQPDLKHFQETAHLHDTQKTHDEY